MSITKVVYKNPADISDVFVFISTAVTVDKVLEEIADFEATFPSDVFYRREKPQNVGRPYIR